MSGHDPYAEPPPRPPKGRVWAVVATVGFLFVALAIWGFAWARDQWSGGGSDARSAPTSASPAPSTTSGDGTTTAPDPATPSSTSSTRREVALPAGARVCDGTADVRVAAGTPRTSCTFATAVRDAWVAAGKGSGTVVAHSAVTDRDYSMTCGGSELTTCRGGDNAVVYLY